MHSIKIAGINFFNGEIANILDNIEVAVLNKVTGKMIVTINTDIFMRTRNVPEFAEIVERSWINTADGMPIVWLSKLLRSPLSARVTGADLTYEICKQANERSLRPFFLGGEPGVAETAQKNIESIFGKTVCGTYAPSPEELLDRHLSLEIVKRVNISGANVLLVALGSPKQEKWIYTYKDVLNVSVSIGVGASLDFIAGKVKRAPLWVQNAGFEWAYRLSREPTRLFRRYLSNLSFLRVVIKEVSKM